MTLARQLFLSRRTRHGACLEPLLAALAAHGISVWHDRDLVEGTSITAGVRDALASSHALAVFASEDYPDSMVCAWELASAWIASERVGQAQQRVLLLRPHDVADLAHVRVGSLRDTRAHDLPAPTDAAALERVAAAIAAQTHGIDPRPFGALHDFSTTPVWLPWPRIGSRRFVGRMPQLWQLHDLLVRTRIVGITGHIGRDLAQIRGLGGIGKSLLAVEYARRFEAAWPGGIFWVDADPAWASAPATLAERETRRQTILAGFAISLGVPAVMGDLGKTARAVERALATHTAGRPHLWILDNLPPGLDHASVEALLPSDPAGALLITTRWMALEALTERLDLGILDATAAYTLITARRPPTLPTEVAAARALADDVGRHPLALDVLGALVREELTGMPYSRWRARLAAPDNTFDLRSDALQDQLPTGCARAITRVLANSLSQLRSALSLDILRIAALLAEAPIPGSLLIDTVALLGCGSEDDVTRAIADLANHALVEYAPDVSGIRVHAVVRWVAHRLRVKSPHPKIDVILEQVCEALGTRLNDIDDIAGHGALLDLVPHAEVIGKHDTFSAVLVGATLGHFLEIRGDYHAAKRLAARAVDFFASTLRPINPHAANAKNNLAIALSRLGDVSAAENYFGQALVEYEQLYGAEHPRTLMALHNLGSTWEAVGDLAAARRIYERICPLQVKVLGVTHRETLQTRMHLGGILSELGDLAGSRKSLESVVDLCKETFGPTDPLSVRAQEFLAVTLRRQGENSQARALEAAALSAARATWGPEHPTTLRAATQLSSSMAFAGDHAGSQALAEQTLAIQTRVLGPDNPDTLRTRYALGETLMRQRAFVDALSVYEPLLAAYLRSVGPRHPYTMMTQENIAWAHRELGDLTRARTMLAEVVAGREDVLGPGHPDTTQARVKLADVLLGLGAVAEARPHIIMLGALRGRAMETLSTSERAVLAGLGRLELAAGLTTPPRVADSAENHFQPTVHVHTQGSRRRRRRRPPSD